jgi:DNA repair exonuclease SbcCD ATPase subunit
MVDEFAASWRDRKDAAVRRMEAATDNAHGRETRRAELAKATPPAKEYDALMDACRKLEVAAIERRKAHDSLLASWEAGERLRAEVLATQAEAKKRHQAARVRGDDLSARLAAIPVPDVTDAGERLGAATEALRAAEEAAGALKAYRDAVARAESEQVAEKAWKAAEAACKRARESYVADVVRPLVDDVAALLAAAGRSERVYLELENERGKPVFDLGWIAGSRRSLSALSGGEAVLFCAALAVTIAKRSTGRRVLLIEADPLDEQNLMRLLDALAAMKLELDACLVATASHVVDMPGWKIERFGDQTTR